jgi:NADPH2:quinone reductase
MNAAVVESLEKQPQYGQFEDPVAQQGESVVRVLAAGLHPIVRSLAKGAHYGSTGKLPFVPGVDGVGRLGEGSRVFFAVARPPFGSFAERTVAAPPFLIPVPDAIPDSVAAAIGNPAMSSCAALSFRAKFVADESVLILGATGVAGLLAVQIAKRRGARRVIACGRNAAALEKAKMLGADATISLELAHDELVGALRDEIARGVDVVLDYLWGAPAEAALEAIAKKGLSHETARIRYVQIGQSAGAKISLAGSTLRSSGLEMIGSGFGSVSMADLAKSIEEFFVEAAKQPFEIGVKSFPLREVGERWGEDEGGDRFVFVP